MSEQDRIKKIAVIGGGSAGWMTAAALSNLFRSSIEIVLVESEKIGTVGVGEASITSIKSFNAMLGIDEADFLSATQGTIKLGINFVDWSHLGASYFHPFGRYARDFDVVPLYQYWLKARAEGDTSSLDEYSMSWAMAKNNRFSPPAVDVKRVQSTYDYAYHFDATLYAKFLRRYAEARGVTRIEGQVEDVQLALSDEHVQTVRLGSGLRIDADLFVDCTGFAGVLIEGALRAGYENWSQHLFCDRAVAVASEHVSELSPYTKSIACKAGWQWRIPLQHRMGNGYVYCSQYVSEDEATNDLLCSIEGEKISAPKTLKFVTGHRKKFWSGNCIAIGLSAGFLEQLESTSLHLIHSGINRLLALFPSQTQMRAQREEYNRLAEAEYRVIRDFLILHYFANQRQDSEFWQRCASMKIPDSLAYRVSQFRDSAHIVPPTGELFQTYSWLAVLIGQSVLPKNYSPMADIRNHVNYEKYLSGLKNTIQDSALAMPMHREYLDRCGKA